MRVLQILLKLLAAKEIIAEGAEEAVPLLTELAQDDYRGAAEVLKGYGTSQDLIAAATAELEQAGIPAALVPVALDIVLPLALQLADTVIPEEKLLPIAELVAAL